MTTQRGTGIVSTAEIHENVTRNKTERTWPRDGVVGLTTRMKCRFVPARFANKAITK